jgi:hypothetical protein
VNALQLGSDGQIVSAKNLTQLDQKLNANTTETVSLYVRPRCYYLYDHVRAMDLRQITDYSDRAMVSVKEVIKDTLAINVRRN